MTSFDQRGQQVGGNQYNADRIIFNQQVVPLSLADGRQKVSRRRMLKRVRDFWIKGVLEKSLHGAPPIILSFYQQEDAHANPWSKLLQEYSQSAKELPLGTRISQVYDEEDGKLLILGEPGSGKTTLLLELAEDLLSRAECDDTQPIPAIFLLSSWTTKRQPIAEWLVEELEKKYDVPPVMGQLWIENEQILPLLDGLDEVASQHRLACLRAINDYRQEHHLSLVVCSRISEYLALPTPLMLHHLVVQPLTEQQVEDYLLDMGEQSTEIRLAIHTDPALRDLAMTPLMLSILMRAYQGKPSGELLAMGSSKTLRQQIFKIYVERMLQRRSSETRYSSHQTIYWLTFLAQQLLHQNQTAFFLEQMQPSWLASSRLQRMYELLAVRIPDIVIGILISLLISTLLFGYIFNMTVTLIYGITGGLVGGLISREKQRILPARKNKRPWRYLLQGLVEVKHFGSGLMIGLSYGLVYGLSYGLVYGLSYGSVFGCISVLLSVTFEGSKPSRSSSPPTSWSWRNYWHHLLASGYLRIGLIVGITYGVGYALSTEIAHQFLIAQPIAQHDVAANIIAYILNYTLIGVLLCVIIEERQTTIQPAEVLVWSWRNLWYNLANGRRLRNGLLIGLVTGTIIEICDIARRGWGMDTLAFGLNVVPIFGLSYWLFLGLLGGLSNDTLSDPHRVKPNQGIQRSAQHSILVGTVSGFIVWLIYTLSYGVDYTFITALNHNFSFALEHGFFVGLSVASTIGLYVGIMCGLICGLLYGGLACIEHSVLCLLLWYNRSTPWDYARFLDYAHERILLRKIGGGYIFIHHQLLEYFASLQ